MGRCRDRRCRGLDAGSALADCNIVGLGGDLTNQSDVTVNCDATENTAQGDGTNNNVVLTVGGGATLDTGGDDSIVLGSTGNAITVNGTVAGNGNFNVFLAGPATQSNNSITVNGGGLITGGYTAIRFQSAASNNTITVNAGATVSGYATGLHFGASASNNTIDIAAGGLVRGDSYGILFTGPASSNVVTVNGTVQADCNCSYGLGFLGDAIGNTITVGAAGSIISTSNIGLAIYGTSTGNTITVNAGGLISGYYAGMQVNATNNNNNITVNGTVLGAGTSVTSSGMNFYGTATGNQITIGAGSRVSGTDYGINFKYDTIGNTINVNGTLLTEVTPAASDLLVVGGTATLTGGTAQFSYLEPVLSGSYTFLTAGSIVGQYSSVVLPPSLFLGGAVSYTGNSAVFTLTHTSFVTAAPAENQQATAVALDLGYASATGDAFTVMNAFNTFTSVPAAANAFGQLGGQVHTSLQTTGVASAQQFTGAVRQHLRRDKVRGGGTTATAALADASSAYTTN